MDSLLSLDDSAFITYCYERILLRGPDPEGLVHHRAALQSAPGPAGRFALMASFLASRECPLHSPFIRFARPGHFYSPLPEPGAACPQFARERDAAAVEGIDCRVPAQLARAESFAELYPTHPYAADQIGACRYRCDNNSFAPGDALTLHFMMRIERPRRIIEVGSGWSSAVMLDTRERHSLGGTELTFIEPYPDRLETILRRSDRDHVSIHVDFVQNVDVAIFDRLEPGDFLFIDSSHVLKTGSDVAYLYFKVLPRLPAGVFVHIHDVFWPFDYPASWYDEGRCWNEGFLVRALLQRPSRFAVEFFGDYLAHHHASALGQRMPLYARNAGCSIWLQTVESGLVP